MKNTLHKNSLGLERVIWILILAIFTSLALFWSYDVFDQWQAHPVLTSVKTTGTYFTILTIHTYMYTFHLAKNRYSIVTIL